MENSDILHGKKSKNWSAFCKIFAKIACHMESFGKIRHYFRIQFDVLRVQKNVFPLEVDWNPESFSEGKGKQRNTQIKSKKRK